MTSLRSIDNRLPWSFFGVVLGAISLAIAIGFFYLAKRDDRTDLQFRVEDEFPLVEVKDKFPDLKVLFKKEDILESGKEIKILRLLMVNEGRSILQSFYDQHLPFGLAFQKSKILAVSPVSPTTGYLCDNLFRESNPDDLQKGLLVFGKPIIERGNQVSFKVYLIQDKGIQTTKIETRGKISGLDQIPVLAFDPTATSPGRSIRSTGEVIGIGFAAGYGGMFALMLTLMGVISYSERRDKRKRKEQCQEFLNEHDELTAEQRKIIEGYAEGWRAYSLATIRTLVLGDHALDLSELVERVVQGKGLPFPSNILHRARLQQVCPLRWDPAIFFVSDGKISLNEKNREVLLTFLRHCKEIDVEQNLAAGGEDAAAEG